MRRRIAHAVAALAMIAIAATAALAITSQTMWFKNWLRGFIVREASQYVNGTLSIGGLGGNLLFGVELENIRWSKAGRDVVAIQGLALDYNAFELLSKGLSVRSIHLNRPEIHLRRDGDRWELSGLLKKEQAEADRSGPARPVTIDAISMSEGTVIFESPLGLSGVNVPRRIEHGDARLSFRYEPVRYSIEISQLSFRGSDPAFSLNSVSGGVSVKDDTVFVSKLALRTAESSVLIDGAVQRYLTEPVLALQISSDKTSLPEIAPIVPALTGIHLQPSFNIAAAGPVDHLKVEAHVESTAGQLRATVTAGLVGPGQSLAGSLSVRNLNLSPFLDGPNQTTDITADVRLSLHGEALTDLRALHGTIALDSPRTAALGYVAEQIHAKATLDGPQLEIGEGRASAYGAAVTVAGRVVLPATAQKESVTTYDVHGDVAHLDIRRLPPQLGLPPGETDVAARYRAVGSVAATAHPALFNLRIASSRVAGATIADGSTASVALDGAAVTYSADAAVSDLDLQEVGRQFRIAALTADSYAGRINGHVTMSGRGTTLPTIDLTASGTLTDTTILGGRVPQVRFDVSMADDTIHVKADGQFDGFDPAVLTGEPRLKGQLAGTLDAATTIARVSNGVALDSVQSNGTLTLLSSTVGGLDIDSARLDGSYRDSVGDVRSLNVMGHDVSLEASGILALNETGSSNFAVHAGSSNLATIGKLVDAPLAGLAKADATITGNRRRLQAAGTLSAGELAYGDTTALTVSSQFTANMPDLSSALASVDATTHATFVTIGGQNINEVDAKTTYREQHLDFDATARQPQRSARVAGAALFHPDHQEVHLQQLNLESQGQTWKLAPDADATINYAKENAVTLSHVMLTNGAQQIAADGTIGHPGEALQLTLTDVDLAAVNALLLRPPQFSGTFSGSATVTGSVAAPMMDATFDVANGGFQQFRYASAGGTARYTQAGITLDARLQQNPTTYLTAKGYVPTALFTGTAAGTTSANPSDRIDLHIESTPIDLGLIQGFTNALNKVTGTVQLNIDVTGSAADPRPAGTIAVADGAFTVAATGVLYTNMRGQIELRSDRAHIDNMSILDNQKNALSITGDLAIRERQIGGVQLYVTARDFKIIDNKIGNVRVDSDLQIAGQVDAPRIEGDLAVRTGQVNLDEILARISDAAYATEQIAYQNDASNRSGSPLDPLQIEVHLTMANDVVVKANDLRAPGAPIGLGALNVTLGGDLWISKVPWDQTRLVGRINTVRGTYDFEGRRFDILRDGLVRFDGTDELDPALDIKTERLIQGVTANVNLRGTLNKPEVVLSSTPPLEQADVLSLIVFNQPINQLGEGQQVSLASRAQQLATGVVASQVAQSIGKALGVDTFEISTAPDSGAAAQVTVGQQVSQNLFIKVQQDLGDQSQTEFILEYELTRWLRLQTNVMQGSPTTQQLFQRAKSSGVDLLFFFSF